MPQLNVGEWCGYCGKFVEDMTFLVHLAKCEKEMAEHKKRNGKGKILGCDKDG